MVYHFRTWAEAAGQPETSARLDRLPAGVTFPEPFPEPIRYDVARKRLTYRGFMASASYRYLQGLSVDPAYRTALDEIYLASSYILDRPGLAGRAWPWLVGLTGMIGAAFLAWRWFH